VNLGKSKKRMNRIVKFSERNVQARPAIAPIAIAADNGNPATSVQVLADETKTGGEIAQRILTNSGANPVYIGIGQRCSANAYQTVIPAGGMFEVPGRQIVYASGVGGVSTVVALIIDRLDLAQQQ
jgi:hypothetical protein